MKNGIEIHFAFAEALTLLKMGLRKDADQKGSFKMIEEANDSPELLQKLLKNNTSLHISIIAINDGDNLFKILQDIESIKMKWPAMGILVYTVPLHRYFINQLIRLGANGILNKQHDCTEDIFGAMSNIRVSGFHYGSLASRHEFEAVHQKKINVSPLQERDIVLIRYRCEGKTYKKMATILNEDYMTVYRACAKLKSKLNLKERYGLINFGHHAGIDFERPKMLKFSVERGL